MVDLTDPSLWALTTGHSGLSDQDFEKLDQYEAYMDECYAKLQEVNATLSNEKKFNEVSFLPRALLPTCFADLYKKYRMSNTNPTSVRCKRLMEPCVYKCKSKALLQILSFKFAGDFLHYQPMSIYGSLAVRDNVDRLRNYLFNRSSDNAHEISRDSPELPLISPSRAISAGCCAVRWINEGHGALIECSIRVKNGSKDGSTLEDQELVDGCFEHISWGQNPPTVNVKSRIYGPLGPVDIEYMFISDGVEASIDVNIKRAARGYSLEMVTAFTSGCTKGVVLYDRSISCQAPSTLILKSSVMAVSSRGKLKLIFDINARDDRAGDYSSKSVHKSEGKKRTRKSRKLSFAAHEYGNSVGSVVIGGSFELAAKVMWSTMGKHED